MEILIHPTTKSVSADKRTIQVTFVWNGEHRTRHLHLRKEKEGDKFISKLIGTNPDERASDVNALAEAAVKLFEEQLEKAEGRLEQAKRYLKEAPKTEKRDARATVRSAKHSLGETTREFEKAIGFLEKVREEFPLLVEYVGYSLSYS